MNWFCRLWILLSLCSIYLDASNTREGKITGGYKARPHSNPYVVALLRRYLWRRYRHCTGSILSERWILSSGHCVTDSGAKWYGMDAVVGAHSLEEVTSSMIYQISDRIAHPRYRGGVGPYDISMMKTSRNIEFSDKVQPIRLPVFDNMYEKSEDLLITGWGAIKHNYFVIEIPNKLREAQVTYLPYDECYRAIDNIKDKYESNPLRKYHNLCTGIPISGSKSGCTGDSGGPLVQYVKIISTQIDGTETTTNKEKTTTTMKSTTRRSTTYSTPKTTYRTSTITEKSTFTTANSTKYPVSMTTETLPAIDAEITTQEITLPTIEADMTTEDITLPTIEVEMTTENEIASGWQKRLSFDRTSGVDYGNNPQINNIRAMEIKVMPTVVGVISWGVVPCGTRGAPTVYSNVSNYMEFITTYLKS